MTEEKSIFDEAEVSEVMPEDDIELETADNEELEEWKPIISKESPKERKERVGEKKKMDGKVLTIKSIFHTRPRTKNSDGTRIAPKKTLDGKTEFYPGKLGIRFEEENLIEYYPNFHYFLTDEGKISTVTKINREGKNAVSKMFQLVVKKIGRPIEEISDQEFYDFLPGKKVKIKTDEGDYMGKHWFRNDIVDFV